MASYPSDLPQAMIADYSVQTSTGISAVRFENGFARQRRTARRDRQVFTLSFVFTTSQLWEWQIWANVNGYAWHTMDMESPYSGLSVNGQNLIPHTIRYVSSPTVEVLSIGYVKVSVSAEMDVTTLPQGIVTFTGNWIRAGTPASPSSSAYYRAGIPATPSTDTVTAGSPALPAA